ncbi:5,10-methylenetetrahydromethanopterin reductase [Agrococcus sp. UYP10]|uniref:LLM class flavin-dependent oxidoreductase n=1 Tax=Agrococcus sp. UYP10 TaxID=1756355 RepID=UPI0033935369
MHAAPTIGLIIPPDQAPERFLAVARAAEQAGVDEVWLWEDCFGQSGTSTAAAVLAATERIRVGIGLMPVPLRNVALTAMEIATLGRMFPGRLLPGIGHGVLEWMAQAGVRAQSPLTLLTEQATALRTLLAGDELSVEGRYVRLDRVRLRWLPEPVPPLLIGGGKPKTLGLAGELGDGVILAGDLTPDADRSVTRDAIQVVRDARAAAGLHGAFDVVQFAGIRSDASVDEVSSFAAALGELGVTSVPLIALGPDGEPEAGDGILQLAATIGDAARAQAS